MSYSQEEGLKLIVGDYRAQFGLVRDYGNEVESIAKFLPKQNTCYTQGKFMQT